MTSIEDFTSQYGLVQKIDAFGYLDYLKKNPDAPRKHGKVVLVTADTPLKASRGEGKTTTTIALIDALRERGIDAAAVLRQPSMGITAAGSKGGASGGGKASLTHPELIDWGLCGEMGAIEPPRTCWSPLRRRLLTTASWTPSSYRASPKCRPVPCARSQ
mgnify:CR=1 FL=1